MARNCGVFLNVHKRNVDGWSDPYFVPAHVASALSSLSFRWSLHYGISFLKASKKTEGIRGAGRVAHKI